MNPIGALQNYLVITAAIATVVAVVRFLDGRRLKVTMRGGAEVVNLAYVGWSEEFVLYVVNDRDHPVTVEACGVVGQNTTGGYWRLSLRLPPEGIVVAKGAPYRWEMLFKDVADFGIDVDRRVYGFARIAQPAKDIWSRRFTAGPQRGTLARPRPAARARPAGQSPAPPPWWVLLLK
jgi:hypothetical protein